MQQAHFQIAIDGPAGAGKSTIAKAVAQALHILYLDTGAMYRALALFALQKGVDPNDEAAVNALLPYADISVRYENDVQKTYLNGEDVSGQLRTPPVSKGASDIAVHPAVRLKMVELQQQVARETPVVMDGRDIGTYVLPQAPYKFFVTASPQARAQRRLLELKAMGADASLEELVASIIARDHTDSTRAFAPLKQASDAILLDTTHLDIQQSVQAVLDVIQRPQGE